MISSKGVKTSPAKPLLCVKIPPICAHAAYSKCRGRNHGFISFDTGKNKSSDPSCRAVSFKIVSIFCRSQRNSFILTSTRSQIASGNFLNSAKETGQNLASHFLKSAKETPKIQPAFPISRCLRRGCVLYVAASDPTNPTNANFIPLCNGREEPQRENEIFSRLPFLERRRKRISLVLRR